MSANPSGRRHRRVRVRRGVAALAVGTLAAGLLSACGGVPDNELVWYINPDNGGQAAVAKACSQGKPYTITTQQLPQDAGQQRIQLARRLAAEDDTIDLMSIDPPFTAEFSNAGYLAPIPDDAQQRILGKAQPTGDGQAPAAFEGAAKAATWDDEVVVFPFWSNTQVLWYRKSFLKNHGLDDVEQQLQSGTATWAQLIDAAAKNGGTVAVQANKYEGYVVWINALIAGAGGQIATDTEKGQDATIGIDSDAGRAAAAVIEKLARSKAAPPDLSVSQEGQAASSFAAKSGAFLVNWTYIWNNYEADTPGFQNDIGYARYPRTVDGQESHAPYGGIGIGVSAYSQKKDWAMEAAECITTAQNQAVNAQITGNMPSSTAGYEALKRLDDQRMADERKKDPSADPKPLYPDDLLQLFQDSLDAAAPRTVTPYWSDISGAIQSRFHPPGSVDQDTPAEAQRFIEDVLHGRSLL